MNTLQHSHSKTYSPTFQTLTLEILLRICYRFGERKSTLLIIARTCRELHLRIARFLYTTATEENASTLAKTSTTSQLIRRMHYANFVQHVSFFVPITTDEIAADIRDALKNIALYRNLSTVITFRLINSNLTMADIFSDEIPPCFQKVETLDICGVSSTNNQQTATMLTLQMFSVHLTNLTLDLHTTTRPVNYSTLSEWFISLVDRAPHLQMLSLRLDDRFVSHSAHKFQQLLDSSQFTFKQLTYLKLYDAYGIFHPSLFFNRHQNLLHLRYISNPRYTQNVIDFTTMSSQHL
ncbi:hypothetical protein GG344DRAFT_83480 [Lentinula edodes]|nr:hypothetical protein GG344DRAFT_83480 [Lentinula edodes]